VSNCGRLLFVGGQLSICEVVVHWDHLAVTILYGVYVEDSGWIFNSWSEMYFLNDNFFPPFFFVLASFDKMLARVLCPRGMCCTSAELNFVILSHTRAKYLERLLFLA
jgi:hypothetical protein